MKPASKEPAPNNPASRRSFLKHVGLGSLGAVAAAGLLRAAEIMALNPTVPGIVAHQSALKNGELLKIPQYA